MKENYKVLTTLVERIELTRTTERLESAGIPVVVENLSISDEDGSAAGYRVMVPYSQIEHAIRLVSSERFDIH